MNRQILPLSELSKTLRAFKLSGMVETLEMRLEQAGEDKLSCSEFGESYRFKKRD